MADMPWEHAAEARAALNAIVTDPEHGVAALSSPRTMSNLLKDLLPDAPREKNLVLAAAEAGPADKLRGHVAQGMDSSTAIRLTASTFSDSTPLTPDACSWVAGEIAVALGISTPAEIGMPGAAAAGAGQIGSAQSAASGPGGSYSSEAPTREHARPPVRELDSTGAQGSGQAAAGSFGRAGAASLDQSPVRDPGQHSSQEPGQIPPQMPSLSSPEQASQGFPQGNQPFPQSGQGFPQGGQGFPQGGQGSGSASDPGYPEAPAQSYPQGPVAGVQQPGGYPQPGYAQPSYPQPGYQPGAPAWAGAAGYASPKTNGLAIAALVCGIVQFFGFWLLGTIPAIVLGHIARKQIRQRGEQGAGPALAGLILGYAGLALTVIVVIIIVVAVNSAPST
jgi:Domain of unknown function (DUF4190)